MAAVKWFGVQAYRELRDVTLRRFPTCKLPSH